MYTPLKRIINGRPYILKQCCKIKYIIYYMRKLQIMFLLYIVNRLRLKMYLEIKLSKLKIKQYYISSKRLSWDI
jgi:hypothetical protein